MSVVFLDQFTDTAVTALSAHTPSPTNTIAASWSSPDNGFFIYTDGVTAFTFNGHMEVLDTGLTDYTYSLDVNVVGTGAALGVIAGPVVRYQDSTNFWFIWIRNDTNKIQLFKQVSGSNTKMDEQSYTVPSSGTVTITVTVTSAGVSATVSGGPTVSANDTDLNTATKVGIYDALGTGSGSSATYDNPTVDDGGGGGGGGFQSAWAQNSNVLVAPGAI